MNALRTGSALTRTAAAKASAILRSSATMASRYCMIIATIIMSATQGAAIKPIDNVHYSKDVTLLARVTSIVRSRTSFSVAMETVWPKYLVMSKLPLQPAQIQLLKLLAAAMVTAQTFWFVRVIKQLETIVIMIVNVRLNIVNFLDVTS